MKESKPLGGSSAKPLTGSIGVALSSLARGASRRLRMTAIIALVVWGLYAVLELVLVYEQLTPPVFAAHATAVLASLGLVIHLRPGHVVRHPTAIGFAYEALLALCLSISEFRSTVAIEVTTQVSWVCVLLLFFPLLVPAPARITILASLAVAAMSPIGYAIEVAFGAPLGGPEALFFRFLPQFVCAGIAGIVAHVIHGLASDVKRAKRLGSYELVERLGAGAMGEVWRARHRFLVRPAAIKLIRAGAGDAELMRQRFEREAQATAALESPHTVQLYDFGVSTDGAFYYAMELLRGIDMERLVARFGPQPGERVVHLLRQICDSLDDAHRTGLVHRDIKPANLYLAVKGRRVDFVKVLDFGLVKLTAVAGEVGTTGANNILGTPAYLAPEMATGEPGVDGRADIYALGCVAYELLTGERVFEGGSALEVAVAHATREPVPLSRRADTPIPRALEEIVMACLQKNPTDRPTALRLRKMLEECGLERGWTAERAQKWWEENLPDLLSGAQAVDPSDGPTTRFLDPV